MNKSYILAFVLIVLALTDPSLTQKNPKYEAVMISTLWRHGARTARENVFKLTGDPQVGSQDIFGNGFRMHYVLGQQISQFEYPNLFKDTDTSKYLIYSSQAERTMMSGFSFAMGLFPPGKGPKVTPESTAVNPNTKIWLPSFHGINPNLIPTDRDAIPRGVLPVPIISIDEKNDDIFNKGMQFTCAPAYKKQHDVTAKENMVKNSKLFDSTLKPDLDKHFPVTTLYPKFTTWDLKSIGYVSDEFKSFKAYTGKYPDNTGELGWKFKYAFGILMYEFDYTDTNVLRLWTDKLSKRLISELDQRIAKVTDAEKARKRLNFLGFSGHETTIFPFMLGYKLTSEQCMLDLLKSGKDRVHQTLGDADLCLPGPDFAASFIWELTKTAGIPEDQSNDPSKHFIRVLYNGEPLMTHCPKDKIVDDGFCPYLEFKKAEIARFQFANEIDRLKACNADIDPPKSYWKLTSIILFVLLAGLIAFYMFCTLKKTAGGNSDINDGGLSAEMV